MNIKDAVFLCFICGLLAFLVPSNAMAEGNEAEEAFRKALKFELIQDYKAAKELYAEAASLGLAKGYLKLGDMAVLYDYPATRPTNADDYRNGYDEWIIEAGNILTRAGLCYDNAEAEGGAELVRSSRQRLDSLKSEYEATKTKVSEAKKQGTLQSSRNDNASSLVGYPDDVSSVNVAVPAVVNTTTSGNATYDHGSPEYYIANGLELSSSAFREVVEAITFNSDTGNELYDREQEEGPHSRFKGKTLCFRAKIKKIETTFFTDEVKMILTRDGSSISARFDGMSKSSAVSFRPGQSIVVRGRVSERIVLSTFAMDYCEIIR